MGSLEGKPAKSGQIRKFVGVLTLILIGYSLLLAVRVKMQKLSIELEKETKTVNSSDSNVINRESMKSKVNKRSLPVNKVRDHPDRKIIAKSPSHKILLEKNSS